MHCTLIHNLPHWQVISYDNGIAYELAHTTFGMSICFAGEDAVDFRTSLEALTCGTPSLTFADAFVAIWYDYGSMAEPMQTRMV